jgi:hypothetical protein
MPGAIRRTAQVLSPGGGIEGGAADRTRRFLLGWVSVPDFRGPQADGGEAVDVVAGVATGVGGLRAQPSVHQCGFVWLTLFDDGVTEDEIVIRERDRTYGYQLAALLCFAIFADNVLRRIEGAGQTVGFWLSSGRWELISVFGILSVALQLLFWSEVVPPAKHVHRSH